MISNDIAPTKQKEGKRTDINTSICFRLLQTDSPYCDNVHKELDNTEGASVNKH